MKKNIQSKEITSLIVEQSHHNLFDDDVEKELIHSTINQFIQKNIIH